MWYCFSFASVSPTTIFLSSSLLQAEVKCDDFVAININLIHKHFTLHCNSSFLISQSQQATTTSTATMEERKKANEMKLITRRDAAVKNSTDDGNLTSGAATLFIVGVSGHSPTFELPSHRHLFHWNHRCSLYCPTKTFSKLYLCGGSVFTFITTAASCSIKS